MYRQRLWNFVEDMDYSGSVTISDVWLWVGRGNGVVACGRLINVCVAKK